MKTSSHLPQHPEAKKLINLVKVWLTCGQTSNWLSIAPFSALLKAILLSPSPHEAII